MLVLRGGAVSDERGTSAHLDWAKAVGAVLEIICLVVRSEPKLFAESRPWFRNSQHELKSRWVGAIYTFEALVRCLKKHILACFHLIWRLRYRRARRSIKSFNQEPDLA
jgi:Flp pilus assembly protein protease CpaA